MFLLISNAPTQLNGRFQKRVIQAAGHAGIGHNMAMMAARIKIMPPEASL
jgi:hypothetical protein